jgi:hypothetical protein
MKVRTAGAMMFFGIATAKFLKSYVSWRKRKPDVK